MDKNDNLRTAIDVMTAWVSDDDDTSFAGDRLAEYVKQGPDSQGVDGEMQLMFGLITLAGTALIRLESVTGKPAQWHLQDIAQKSYGN